MADTKITALTAISTVDPAVDVLPIVDVSDTTMAASGTTKKITSNQLLGAGGTATLASATITGDLTVDTSTLKVDSTNNRVGIGTVSPLSPFHVDAGASSEYFRGAGNSGAARALVISASTTTNAGDTHTVNASSVTGVLAFALGGSEAMRLNSTGLGVGVASPAFKIHANGVIGTTNTFGAFTALQTAGGTGYRWTLANDNNFYLAYSADGFGSTSTNRIVLDSSGNVGVGVTPSVRLHVSTTALIAARLESTSASNNSLIDFKDASTTATAKVMVGSKGDALQLYSGGNVSATLDANSNLGIGVTPSAWGGGGRAFEIGFIGTGIQSRNNQYAAWTQNAWYNSSAQWVYGASGLASRYDQDAGTHKWFIAPSGTGGLSIGFTQAMTLDASGRLLVGPISANASGGILQLSSGITFPATQVASSDVNTLDDYEEGTWTPTITAGSGTPTTVTVNSSTYTKIGRMVVCTFDISIVAVGTAASSLQFGLPFTSITSTAFCGSFREDGITGSMGMIFYSTGTTASCLLYNNATPWVNGYRLKGTYTYFAA